MKQYPRPVRILIVLLLMLSILVLLKIGREILITFVVAVFFTFLLMPLSKRLEQWKFPRALAIILSLVIFLGFISGILFFMGYQLSQLIADLPALQEKLMIKISEFQVFITENFGMTETEQFTWLNNELKSMSKVAVTYSMSVFAATGAILANLAIIPILIFFFTYYRDRFKTFINLRLKNNQDNLEVFDIAGKVSEVSGKYMKGLLLDVLILSVLNSIGFLLLGIKYAIFFGFLAGFLNIVPYIGVMIGSILPALMALLTKDSSWYALGVLAVCGAVQFLDNNFITPKVVGSSVSINPLTAMIALLLGSALWGVAGMILFIPISGMLKVVFDEVEPLKPYGYLMGDQD